MTCKDFRKYLYAFADGELETRENLEVLEHLNMCPRCARKVAAQQELRSAVARVCKPEPAPAALRERILANLKRGPAWLRWRRRLVVFAPLAAAAAITLFILLPGQESADDAEFARAVAQLHRMCCDHLEMHHSEDLPRNLTAGEKLSHELHIAVLARSFDDSGYGFHSARICSLDDVPAGHFIYRNATDGAKLSTISVPMRDLGGERVARDGHEYHLFDTETCGIVGWSEGGVSNLVCSEQSSRTLLDLVTSSVVSMRPIEPSPVVVAALGMPLDR